MENLKKVSAPFYFWAPDVARKRGAMEDRHSPFAAIFKPGAWPDEMKPLPTNERASCGPAPDAIRRVPYGGSRTPISASVAGQEKGASRRKGALPLDPAPLRLAQANELHGS